MDGSRHTLRRGDNHADRQFDGFLHSCFFPNWRYAELIELVDDIDRQFAGTDAIFEDEDGNQFIVDIKTRLHTLGPRSETQELHNTFAFEVTQCQFDRGKGRTRLLDGWLIAQGLETTHYLLFYPYTTRMFRPWDMGEVRTSDFIEADYILVSKHAIADLLRDYRLPIIRLVEASILLMQKAGSLGGQTIDKQLFGGEVREWKGRFYWYPNGREDRSRPYLCHSPQYAEKPVNLIIPRPLLEKIAEDHGVVTLADVTSSEHMEDLPDRL